MSHFLLIPRGIYRCVQVPAAEGSSALRPLPALPRCHEIGQKVVWVWVREPGIARSIIRYLSLS